MAKSSFFLKPKEESAAMFRLHVIKEAIPCCTLSFCFVCACFRFQAHGARSGRLPNPLAHLRWQSGAETGTNPSLRSITRPTATSCCWRKPTARRARPLFPRERRTRHAMAGSCGFPERENWSLKPCFHGKVCPSFLARWKIRKACA